VYAAAFVKKRRYWPKNIMGDEITDHFGNKQVGDVDARIGTLHNTPFYVFAMKELEYTTKMMSTHFKYHHMVDDHNSQRHSPLSLEATGATKT
jgi:hypothetical protein